MIILESWKYYEVDIFKLTDNMSDKFIMWSVTLSRDPGSSLLSSSRRLEPSDFRRGRSERWFRMVKLNHFLTGSKEITGNAKSLKSQTSRFWFNLNSARAITCTNLKMCTINSNNKNSNACYDTPKICSHVTPNHIRPGQCTDTDAFILGRDLPELNQNFTLNPQTVHGTLFGLIFNHNDPKWPFF